MAHGYDPKKILGWVARSDKNSPPAPAARQSPSVVPAVTAPAGSVAAVQADEADKAPIAEAVIPQRLEPSLPQQPRTTKAAVIEPRQQPSTSGQQPSTTEQPPRQQRTPEQPVERPSIAIIEGGPAVQLRDSAGRAEPQVLLSPGVGGHRHRPLLHEPHPLQPLSSPPGHAATSTSLIPAPPRRIMNLRPTLSSPSLPMVVVRRGRRVAFKIVPQSSPSYRGEETNCFLPLVQGGTLYS